MYLEWNKGLMWANKLIDRWKMTWDIIPSIGGSSIENNFKYYSSNMDYSANTISLFKTLMIKTIASYDQSWALIWKTIYGCRAGFSGSSCSKISLKFWIIWVISENINKDLLGLSIIYAKSSLCRKLDVYVFFYCPGRANI